MDEVEGSWMVSIAADGLTKARDKAAKTREPAMRVPVKVFNSVEG